MLKFYAIFVFGCLLAAILWYSLTNFSYLSDLWEKDRFAIFIRFLIIEFFGSPFLYFFLVLIFVMFLIPIIAEEILEYRRKS